MSKFLKLISCLVLVAICTFSATYGQDSAIFAEQKTYTRKDSIRGTLGPDRAWFDVHYYDLHLTVEPDKKRIFGYNDIYFTCDKRKDIMQIDLFENMQVDSIVMNGKPLKYTREYNAVFIEMPKKVKKKKSQSLRFHYSGKPIVAIRAPWDGGFVWNKDENGKDFIGVACQGIGASLWWPNKDHQSDEPDSMLVSVAVPKGLRFVGNGNERHQVTEGNNVRYDWFVSYPINNYDISLNIGDYVHFDDTYVYKNGKALSLDYYVLPNNLKKARKHFEQVKPMLECFEQYLGEYPFMDDGFALIETPYLGMEHQSGIAYGNGYKNGYAGNTSYTSGHEFDYIIIHEAGHEWWGNSITAYDVADMWIQEGFCTYTEAIYVECMNSYEEALIYMNDKKEYMQNEKPIAGPYGVQQEGSGDMYSKGSLMLNTLRHITDNDEVWWATIKGLTQDFKHQIVTRDIVIDYMSEKTGKNLRPVFEQYLHFGNIPLLEYRVSGKKSTKLECRWKTDVEKFKMPLWYQDASGQWVKMDLGNKWKKVKIKKVRPKNLTFGEDYFYFDKKETK